MMPGVVYDFSEYSDYSKKITMKFRTEVERIWQWYWSKGEWVTTPTFINEVRPIARSGELHGK